MSSVDVVVVGSLNVDSLVSVETIPAPGETVLGGSPTAAIGGKGLNQAIAAARAGARVAMVGRVGNDDGGRRLRQRLSDEGVDHQHVITDNDAASGSAFITVDGTGENAIVVSPGANGNVSPADVADAGGVIAEANIVVMQLEVPVSAVAAAVRAATGTVVLNPAPAQTLSAETLRGCDLIIPNRTELAIMTGEHSPTDDQIEPLAQRLRAMAADDATIAVTLGADGVMVADTNGVRHQRPPVVSPVDTTGAGDCFCGSLAARLAVGDRLDEALSYALHAAALSVTRPGASESVPTAAQVRSFQAT